MLNSFGFLLLLFIISISMSSLSSVLHNLPVVSAISWPKVPSFGVDEIFIIVSYTAAVPSIFHDGVRHWWVLAVWWPLRTSGLLWGKVLWVMSLNIVMVSLIVSYSCVCEVQVSSTLLLSQCKFRGSWLIHLGLGSIDPVSVNCRGLIRSLFLWFVSDDLTREAIYPWIDELRVAHIFWVSFTCDLMKLERASGKSLRRSKE